MKVLLNPSPDLPDTTLLQDVRLPTRLRRALTEGGLRTVGEVRATSSTALLTFQNLGHRSVALIRELLGP